MSMNVKHNIVPLSHNFICNIDIEVTIDELFPIFHSHTHCAIEYDAEVTRSILMDAALLCLFVFQHSLMASKSLKKFFENINMPAIVRPLYVCCTCSAINVSDANNLHIPLMY